MASGFDFSFQPVLDPPTDQLEPGSPDIAEKRDAEREDPYASRLPPEFEARLRELAEAVAASTGETFSYHVRLAGKNETEVYPIHERGFTYRVHGAPGYEDLDGEYPTVRAIVLKIADLSTRANLGIALGGPTADSRRFFEGRYVLRCPVCRAWGKKYVGSATNTCYNSGSTDHSSCKACGHVFPTSRWAGVYPSLSDLRIYFGLGGSLCELTTVGRIQLVAPPKKNDVVVDEYDTTTVEKIIPEK